MGKEEEGEEKMRGGNRRGSEGYFIIPSIFHSRLKSFLFCKSFPPQPSFFSPGLTHGLFADTPEHIPFFVLFTFSVFPTF